MASVLSQEAKLLARLAELDATAPPAPTRGARAFLVDRALEYAAIARSASTATGRRAALRRHGATRGKSKGASKGYVSIMVRLGEAFRDRPDAELARYRSRRITWKLAQRVVRADRSATEIREALLIEATLWSPGGTRRRRQLHTGAPNENAAAGGAAGHATPPSVARESCWRHDPGWAAREPVGYLEAYERHLRTLHRTVTADLSRALERRDGGETAGILRVASHQSLRQLTAAIGQRRASTSSPETVSIHRRLAALDTALRVRPIGATEGHALDPDAD